MPKSDFSRLYVQGLMVAEEFEFPQEGRSDRGIERNYHMALRGCRLMLMANYSPVFSRCAIIPPPADAPASPSAAAILKFLHVSSTNSHTSSSKDVLLAKAKSCQSCLTGAVFCHVNVAATLMGCGVAEAGGSWISSQCLGHALRHHLGRALLCWRNSVFSSLLPLPQVVFALNQTLLQQESLRAGSFQIPYTTEDLIKHYNCGDLSSIIFNHDTSQVPNFINATLPAHERITAQEIDSYFRQELIYKRNERMGRRVKDLLEEQPDKSFFFAFGAGIIHHGKFGAAISTFGIGDMDCTGNVDLAMPYVKNLKCLMSHFMGNNTVIDVLRREGYEVEHTPAGQAINNRKSPKSLLTFSSSHSPYVMSHELPLHPQKEEEEEEEGFLPHLLFPDSIDVLMKGDRKYKKKKKKQQKKQKLRQFNDLWVRLEESATDPPPRIRIINGYITVEPRGHGWSSHTRADTSSAHQLSRSLFLPLLTWTLQE
ncbi:hypothetical protein DV515_00011151 [Chloebia gouldiae]|uniref:Metalloprotease TIKI n=1 Tax=Chloebia gouldiae TaxID=44316 RepID=A0A3L8S7S9_CHLGU|nr:hypothetical protein DV515_00011151 [Chloebia gouldiae]